MSKKKFLLLSLEEDKAKKIANTINNESSRKILEYLSEKDATETEISNKLKIPLSTVHYNLKQLMDAKLIDWENYHYSEKGKEVKHYTIANKYIIIAPKEDKESLRELIKKISPAFAIPILGAIGIELFSRSNTGNVMVAESLVSDKIMSVDTAESFAVEKTAEVLPSATPLISDPTLYFLIGSLITILFLGIYLYYKGKKKL